MDSVLLSDAQHFLERSIRPKCSCQFGIRAAFETRFIDGSHESKVSPVSMFDMLEGTSWDLAEVTIDGVRKSHEKCQSGLLQEKTSV